MPSLKVLNQMNPTEFCNLFGGVIEHNPWVAEAVFLKRPFISVEDLSRAFSEEILKRPPDLWKKILCCHPELSGKEAVEGKLTEFSSSEQARIGLNRLNAEDFQRIKNFNQLYVEKFAFPCVICLAKIKNLEELFFIQQKRFQNTQQEELLLAIHEVCSIAQFRIEKLVQP